MDCDFNPLFCWSQYSASPLRSKLSRTTYRSTARTYNTLADADRRTVPADRGGGVRYQRIILVWYDRPVDGRVRTQRERAVSILHANKPKNGTG